MHHTGGDVRERTAGASGLVNADGLGPLASLHVEVLDEPFRPLPAYAGDACLPVRENGLRTPVGWRDHGTVREIGGAFRLRVTVNGVRPEDARLFAAYATTG